MLNSRYYIDIFQNILISFRLYQYPSKYNYNLFDLSIIEKKQTIILNENEYEKFQTY